MTRARIKGAFGGVLLALFIALSFDLPWLWLLISGAIGAVLGATLALKGADAHKADLSNC